MTELKSGDIYAYLTPNGKYSTIRIIKLDKQFRNTLLYTTKFYEDFLPDITDERLFKPFDDYSICWVDETNTENFTKVGNHPLLEWEIRQVNKLKNGFEESWTMGANVPYYRWLEKHDPDAFEELLKETDDEESSNNDDYVKCLPAKQFWEIIKLIDFEHEEPLEKAIEKLASLSEKKIYQFEEALAQKLYKLDTEAHAKAIGEGAYTNEEEDYFSPDYFLYVRCLVVAKGKEFYNQVVKAPSLMPKDQEFEPLLELASEAYERKTGEEFDYIPSKDYETFSNEKGWEE
ncbi:DUF4240 domain-containing protein [Bacillus gobiensis]|uniref:DUF4240 domain-containing protein n=1 Tax=Bacillus gobiensis TaxID=1441095 RepID=UPI003D1B5D3B